MSWPLDLQLSDLGQGKKSLSEQTDRCLSLAYQLRKVPVGSGLEVVFWVTLMTVLGIQSSP